MKDPGLVLVLSYLPANVATLDPAGPSWQQLRAPLVRFVAGGRASFHRAGVALDVATVGDLEPLDLAGLVVKVHDPALVAEIYATRDQDRFP